MGSPYLNSGETIVLTTNRISADSVLCDVMLTTERIFFIDNRNPRFEPRIIPLSAILSVQGGKTPAQDPAITLLFRRVEEGGAGQPLNLIFFQDPNENRRPERDEWVRNLIQLSIRQHERELVPEMPVMPDVIGEKGLRPRVRHGVAPDMVLPLSRMGERQKTPAPLTVIPEEVEGGGEIPERAEAILPIKEECAAPEPAPEEPASDLTSVRTMPPPMPAFPARVIIPQVTEEPLPVKKTPAPPEDLEPAPRIDPEALFRTIPMAVQSIPVIEERGLSPLPVAETILTPESVSVIETAPEQAAAVPHHAAAEPQETAEIIRTPDTVAVEAGITEPSDTEAPGTEPAPEIPQKDVFKVPESPMTLAIPENVTEESVGQIFPEDAGKQEPAVADASPGRHPLPPAREIRPFRTTIAYAAALILIITLGAAGVLLLLPQEPVQTDIPHTPTPPLVTVTTNPPETVLPSTLPSPAVTPVTPRITTPVTPFASLPVSQAGFWLGMNSTVKYFSTVQNSVTPTPPLVTVTTNPPETVLPSTLPSPAVTPVTPRIITPVISIPASAVPQAGLWVRVNSTANYIGDLGNPEMLRAVTGTGDNFYKILYSDRPVQVSVQKQDYSGALLAVAIYRDGMLISSRSVTSPMGSVDLLIDPLTALAPGLTENDTLPEHAAAPAGLENI